MQVAHEILRQLGGKKFLAMTGAKNVVGDDSMLMFSLPNKLAARGINKVRITLTPADTYLVEFFNIRGTRVTPIDSVDDVYCDNLTDIFEDRTGLYVNLGCPR